MKNIFAIIFSISCNLLSFSQITTDTLFTVKGLPITFTIGAEGFILSHVTEHKDPFYHASGLFHSVITTNIGGNVRIPLRFVAESWNFSDKYSNDRNMFTWAKPSIQARINKVMFLDSIVFNVGDLWRQQQGQGLILDYFDAQGGEVKFYKNRFIVSARDLGYGLTGPDDIATFSVGYDSILSIRHFIDYFGPTRSQGDVNISSIDSYVKLNEHFHLYQEAALNLRTYAKAALVGLIIKYSKNKSFIDAKLEFRYYDENFYFEKLFSAPYFESLTALDKPINQYYTYLIRNTLNRVFAGRITGRWYPFNSFFIDADLEPMYWDINEFAYEAAFGFEPEDNIFLRAGIMNKFFNPYRGLNIIFFDSEIDIPDAQDMFFVDNKPFLFAKASFKF